MLTFQNPNRGIELKFSEFFFVTYDSFFYALDKLLSTNNTIVRKTITPDLQPNSIVLSFDTIYDTYFPNLVILEDRIKKFDYYDPRISETVEKNTEDIPSFMDCEVEPSSKVTAERLFCIDKKDRILVTRDYSLPIIRSVKLKMELKSKDSPTSEAITTHYYDILIEIKQPCEATSSVYDRLANSCYPIKNPLPQLKKQTDINDGDRFQIPRDEVNSFLIITGIGGSLNLMNADKLFLSILDHENTVRVKKEIDTVSREKNMVQLDVPVRNTGAEYTVRLTNSLSQILPSPGDLKLHYYVVSKLCLEKECLSTYYNWISVIERLTGSQRSCMNDSLLMKPMFEKCESKNFYICMYLRSKSFYFFINSRVV